MPWMAPVAAVGASLIGGSLSTSNVNATNAAQSQLSQQQMDFQAQQSSTQYQRAVTDMTAAGINPMLASQVGGNAALSGSMAQLQNNSSGIMNAANGVSNAAMQYKQQQLLDSQIYASKATGANQDAQATLNDVLAGKENIRKNNEQNVINTNLSNTAADTAFKGYQSANTSAATAHTQYGLSGDKATSDFFNQTGSGSQYGAFIGNLLHSAGAFANLMKVGK